MVIVMFSATPSCATKPSRAAVLGDVADPGALRGAARPGGTRRPRSLTSPPVLASAPATTRPRVATPALSRPVTPTHLAGVHLQRHAGQAAAGRVRGETVGHDEHHGSLAAAGACRAGDGSARGVCGPAAATACDVADHRRHQVVLGQAGRRRGQHELAVAQHGDVLADLEDLFQVVRDVEDGHARRR